MNTDNTTQEELLQKLRDCISGKSIYGREQALEWLDELRRTPPADQPAEGITDAEIVSAAHRYCTEYRHIEHAPYRFSEHGILEFVRLRLTSKREQP